jgi:hypothetical protein
VTDKPFEMQITERELTQMTADLDEMHRDALPRMNEAVSEWAEVKGGLASAGDTIVNARTSRRGFLMGGAAVLGGIALAACGGNSSKSSAASSGGASGASINAGGQTLTGDLAVVGLATALENLAVGTYQAGIDAAVAGKLGTVPPAVVTFAQTAQMQHKDHAAAWNAILRSAGKREVTGVDMTVKTGVVDPTFAQVKDVGGLAKLALTLENVAAATYLEGIGLVKDAGGIKTAATIQPVEMQHAAILNFVLGQYPVPDTFAKSDGARGLDDKIG